MRESLKRKERRCRLCNEVLNQVTADEVRLHCRIVNVAVQPIELEEYDEAKTVRV